MKGAEKTSKNSFEAAGGTAGEAYRQLKTVFAEWQAEYDRFDVLTPRSWLGLDEGNEALKQCRLNLASYLNDPARNVAGLLALAERGRTQMNDWDKANLREMNRIYGLYSGSADPGKISSYMDAMQGGVEAFVEASTIAEEGDKRAAFEKLKPVLANIFETKRDLVRDAAVRLGMKPSELAASEWNPNITNKEVDRVFKRAQDAYPALYDEAQMPEEMAALPLPPVPQEAQMRIVRRIQEACLSAAGWTPEKLAEEEIKVHLDLYESTSFCWGTPKEMYVAVQAPEKNLIETIANANHEFGHMLYLLGLNRVPEDMRSQPAGRLNGYGTHELSASLIEQAGVREKYFEIIAPIISEELGVEGPEWTAANLHALSQNFRRDDWSTGGADMIPEVAWRIKVERLALDSQLSGQEIVDKMPALYQRFMKKFGKEVDPYDCLPDSDHWLSDIYGYFYSYEHAVVASTQATAEMRRQGVLSRAGEAATLEDYFRPYAEFASENIYEAGRKDTPMTVVRNVTGQEMDAAPFLDNLRNRGRSEITEPERQTGKAAPRLSR